MSSTLHDILRPEVQQFISEHELDDVRSLVLRHSKLHGMPMSIIAEQINGRKKAKEKIPAYYQAKGIVYPPTLNLEQCSSQRTGEFKRKLIEEYNLPIGKAVDLTGGFGIDSWFLSQTFGSVDVVEKDRNILSIARHNHEMLGATNLTYHNTDATDFLNTTSQIFDLIFIDPSRRVSGDRKVFKLSDCSPDITALQDSVFKKSNNLLIKAAPLLDLEAGLRELKFVQTVFVVSVDDECKEVLFLSGKDFSGEPNIVAVNLKESAETFSFRLSDEQKAEAEMSEPLEFLYEANASILKAGAFKSIANRFGLRKIQSNTHIYTSSKLISGFPGRIFKVEAFVKSDAKQIRTYFPDGKANVAVRNYPLSAVELKKKTGLKDGGEKYLLGFSGIQKKYLAVANRLK